MNSRNDSPLRATGPTIPVDWDAPDISRLPLAAASRKDIQYRLFRVEEISEDKPQAHRQAIANIFSGLNLSQCACVYILSGRPDGIEMYLGVATTENAADIHEAGKIFKAGFEGNFLGGRLVSVTSDASVLTNLLLHSRHFGQVTGVPSFNESANQSDEIDFQGVERLVNSLLGESWQLITVAEPGSDEEIRDTLDDIYRIASDLSEHIKQSVQQSENSGYQVTETSGTSDSDTQGTSQSDTRGTSKGVGESQNTPNSKGGSARNEGSTTGKSTNSGISESRTENITSSSTVGSSNSRAEGRSTGSSVALTRERTDKRAEGLLKHLDETLIDRFLRGRAKGMYRTAVYLAAETRSTYERLARGLVATFQGSQSSFTPLRVHALPEARYGLSDLLQLRQLERNGTSPSLAVAHSLPLLSGSRVSAATWLNSEELALISGMPTRELPGLKIRKSVDFALNTSTRPDAGRNLALGHIVQHGRTLPNNAVRLPVDDLCRHVFVTGVTGAGKTTTCLKLLLESELPFLVIEPAKTEYRALHDQGKAIEYYCLGREDLTPFRLNPFELVSPVQNLAGHIDTLKATLAAVFPMEAAMPQIVEEAIIKAYLGKGWMIHESENLLVDNPWSTESEVWPTISDMIHELDGVIKSKGMGREFEEKYRGSLVARLSNLTMGTKGRMLNTRRSINFDQLLDKCVVIELDELKDEQDKALFMGLIITRLAECMKQRHKRQPGFRHLTLVEEAHRLLARPDPGDGGARKIGVEMFANLLAEVRQYGEGLIIADQIPNKLVPDVIKNTNTKIVHRLFAADDRDTIGDAMGLSAEQKDFLPMLEPGETIIYSGGWHAPVRLKVTERASTQSRPLDEGQLRHSGQAQLWSQRAVLLPRLAQHPAMRDAATLSTFLRDATLMLGMLLRLNPKGRTQDERLRERLRERLLQKQCEFQNSADVSESMLADGLCRVFRDCVLGSTFTREADYALLEQAIREGLKQLHTSLTAFDSFANGLAGDEAFRALALLDSI
jgi:hypothetical protein